MITTLSKFALGVTLSVSLTGVASSADPLPDRRGVRPPSAVVVPPSSPAASNDAASRQELVDLLNELETLQAQVRELRGQLEVQANELERLKSRQQDVFADFDRRLREVEQRGAGALGNSSSNAGSGSTGPTVMVTPPTSTTTPSTSTVRTTPAIASPAEQQQYDAAFALMKRGMYEQAAKSFREFVARNPNGPLAANAQYWVGEAAYVTRDFRGALAEFGKVVQNYPESNKVADALLKIGYTHHELGAVDKARTTLQDLIKRHPNTTAAKAAEQRLARLAPAAR